MRSTMLAVLAIAACGGDNGDGDDAPPLPVVSAMGTVTNPVSGVQSGRLIVGVGRVADLPQRIVCSKLLAKFEEPAATLPATFQLDNVPVTTDLVLVAIVIDGSGATQMPGASYSIVVDTTKVRFATRPDDPLDIVMQGTIGFDCP
jgi:hypothetical protein